MHHMCLNNSFPGTLTDPGNHKIGEMLDIKSHINVMSTLLGRGKRGKRKGGGEGAKEGMRSGRKKHVQEKKRILK